MKESRCIEGKFAGIEVGDGKRVAIAGVINLSPESFFRGSVVKPENAGEIAEKMVDEGADIIDIGAMSTAPYKETWISEREEIRKIVEGVESVKDAVDVPVSIDTQRPAVADAGLMAGADAINDITGFQNREMARIVADHGVSAVLMAWDEHADGNPVEVVLNSLRKSLDIATEYGIEDIAVDPGIGFFRNRSIPWFEWDSMVISNLHRLRILNKPIYVGLSRKSFIGKILKKEEPEERLNGSLSATAIAVFMGAHLIRTHDVKETREAVDMAEFIRRYQD